MMGFCAAIIAVVGATLAGRALLSFLERVLRVGHTARPRAEVWGLSILLGMAFTAAAAFVWSDLGGPLNARFSWGQAALGLVAGMVTIIVQRRSAPRDLAPVISTQVHSPIAGTLSAPSPPRATFAPQVDTLRGRGWGEGVTSPAPAPSPRPSPPQQSLFQKLHRLWGRGGRVGGTPPIDECTRSTPHAPGALARACQIGIGVLIALAFVQTLLTPQRFWDERAIFAIKARVLFEAGTIDAPELRHPDFVQYHPSYPLLIPLLERHVYALCGEVQDRWAKVWFPLMYAGLVLSFAGVLSRRTSPDEGWLMATLLATVPVLLPDDYGFLSAQADAPMACFHGVAVLLLWDCFQAPPGGSRRRSLFLAASIAASAVFVKDEGKAFLLVDLLSWGLALLLGGGRLGDVPAGEGRLRSVGRHLVAMVAFALIAAVLLTPWTLHQRTLPTTTEMHYFERLDAGRLIERLSTLRWSIPHLLHRMFWEWRTWGLPWWLVLLALVTAPRRSFAGAQLFLVLNLLGALAAFVAAGMLAPAELEEHLSGSSSRYLMQLVPVAVLFVAGAWGRSGEGLVSQAPLRSESSGA